MNNSEDQKIVQSSDQELARYSSDVVKRGLDFAKSLTQSEPPVEFGKQAIQTKVDNTKVQTQTWKCVRTLIGHSIRHSDAVMSVAISPDGHTLSSYSAGGTINIWNLETGELIRTLLGYEPTIISSDGKLFTSGCNGGKTNIWSLETGELLYTLSLHSELLDYDAISPDLKLITSGYDHAITIYSLQTGEILHTLSSHAGNIYHLAFSPDSQFLAAVSEDTEIIEIWNPVTGELIRTIKPYKGFPTETPVQEEGIYHLAFSPDSQFLATGSQECREDETIKIWNLRTGTLSRTLEPYNGFPIVISPDGKFVVSYVWIWNLHTGKLLYTFDVNTFNLAPSDPFCCPYSFAFSSDSQTLASGSLEGVIKILRLSEIDDALENQDVEMDKQQLPQALIFQGNNCYKSGNYQEAIEKYNELLSFTPNNAEAYNRRSTARSALGDYQGAIEDLQRATNLY